jgi:uncharacterized iron-regulated protein
MKVLILFLLVSTWFSAEDRQEVGERHYRIYRGNGTPATLEELVKDAGRAAVTFLGELHDDPVAHHLEEQILRRISHPELVLSLEMFERDIQYVLDEYLRDEIAEIHLVASGRAWKNYRDYRPLIEFAKERKMRVLAANAPRRYVNRVSRLGAQSLASLDAGARQFLPPLPYAKASSTYAEKFARVMEEQRENGRPLSGETLARRLEAQSLWDAGMSFAIAEFLTGHPNRRVLHVNGSFHTAQRLGTVEHLLRYRPGTEVVVVTMMPEKSFPAFNPATMTSQGDFVVVTDPSLTRSFLPETSAASAKPTK